MSFVFPEFSKIEISVRVNVEESLNYLEMIHRMWGCVSIACNVKWNLLLWFHREKIIQGVRVEKYLEREGESERQKRDVPCKCLIFCKLNNIHPWCSLMQFHDLLEVGLWYGFSCQNIQPSSSFSNPSAIRSDERVRRSKLSCLSMLREKGVVQRERVREWGVQLFG